MHLRLTFLAGLTLGIAAAVGVEPTIRDQITEVLKADQPATATDKKVAGQTVPAVRMDTPRLANSPLVQLPDFRVNSQRLPNLSQEKASVRSRILVAEQETTPSRLDVLLDPIGSLDRAREARERLDILLMREKIMTLTFNTTRAEQAALLDLLDDIDYSRRYR